MSIRRTATPPAAQVVAPVDYLDYVNSVATLARVLIAETSPVLPYPGWESGAREQVNRLGRITDQDGAAALERIGWRLDRCGGWLQDIGAALRVTGELYASGYPVTLDDFENAESFLDELMRLVDRFRLVMPDDIVVIGQDAPTVPVSRFNDDDITANDFPRWASVRGYFSRLEEAAALERLEGRILQRGLRKPVEVVTYNGQTFVGDGHHRVEVLRKLGRDVPIRWRAQQSSGHLADQPGVPPPPRGSG